MVLCGWVDVLVVRGSSTGGMSDLCLSVLCPCRLVVSMFLAPRRNVSTNCATADVTALTLQPQQRVRNLDP